MSATLAEVVARKVPIHWYEAVAIAQELCGALRDSDPTSELPELRDVQITPEGEVRIIFGRPTTDPATKRVGQIFHALLQDDMPVQLRLLATQAVTGVFVSLNELSTTLAYFERPDPHGLVRAVYERWEAAPPPPPAAEEEPQLETPPDSPAPVAAARLRHGVRRVVLPAIVMAVVAGGIWELTRPGRFVRLAGSSAILRVLGRAKDVAVEQVAAGASTIKNQMGFPSDSPDKAEPSPVENAPDLGARPPARKATSRSRASRSPAVALKAYDLEAVLPKNQGESQPPETADGAGAAPASSADPVKVPEVSPTIYGSDDAEVAPPVSVHPVLPTRLPAGKRLEDLGIIEILINETGQVEAARLHSSPTRLDGLMILSAAKAWRFRPATKNGRPVKYRKMVWISIL